MKVHNINGTSDNKCKCGSWKAHWEKFNELKLAWPIFCSEKSCINTPTLGAHVQKESCSTAKCFNTHGAQALILRLKDYRKDVVHE